MSDYKPGPISHIQLVPIWTSNIHSWFIYAENEFMALDITDQRLRFQATLRCLTRDLYEEITPQMTDPQTLNAYDLLKAALLKRLALTDKQRADELFRDCELGANKPTQLLRRMRQLLNGQQLDELFLRQLFLQRLPTQAQTALAACRSVPLDELAETADAVLEAFTPSLNAIRTPPAPPPIPVAGPSTQYVPLEDFKKMFAELMHIKAELRQRSRSRSYGRHRYRSSSRRSRQSSQSPRRHPDWCWYHERWGDKAHKCVQPCAYSQRQSGN